MAFNLFGDINTSTKTTPASGPFNLFGGSAPTQAVKKPNTKNFIPSGATALTLPNGNTAVKTPSGTTWEYTPDGNRVVNLASQFGNGSYNVNTQNPKQTLTTKRDDNALGLGAAQKGMERDHIIPVSLGGASNSSNGRLTTGSANQKGTTSGESDDLEKNLASDVKTGKLTLGQAREQIIAAKNQNKSSFLSKVGSAADDILTGATRAASLGALLDLPDAIRGAKKDRVTTKQFVSSLPGATKQTAKAVSGTILAPVVNPALGVQQEITGQDVGQVETPFGSFQSPQSQRTQAEQSGSSPLEANLGVIANQAVDSLAFVGTFAGLDAAATRATLALSDLAMKKNNITITFADAQKIVNGEEVSPEKLRAFKDAASENPKLAQQLRKGQTKLSSSQETPLSQVLKEAANKKFDLFKLPSETTQGGFVNPSEVVQSVKNKANEVTNFIKETTQGSEASSNLSDDLYKLQKNSEADKLLASQILKKLNIPAKDAEAIYHYEEDKSVQLTPQQQDIYDAYVKPLAESSQKIAEKLKPTGLLTSEDYTPRYIKGKGGLMDRLSQAAEGVKNIGVSGKGGLLNKSAQSLKRRTMKAIVDGEGNRTVVSIKGGKVTGFNNKNLSDLGALKVKSNEQLLNEDIKPLQNKLTTLQKKLDGISSVKAFDPISKGRVSNVREELNGVLEQAFGVSDQAGSSLTSKLKTRRDILIKELKTLESVKTGEQVTNISNRIIKVQKEMVALSNEIGDIESKYNPDELNNKKFVDKNGKAYKITEATTKEIEKHTNLTYHKNAIVNRITNYLDLRNKERAIDFLDKMKESPDFKLIAKKFGDGIAPEGWRSTKLQNLAGYSFEPHVAATLDKFAGDLASSKPGVLTKVNAFLRTAIFFNPLIHIPNITVHWAVNRGVTPFLNPFAYKKFIGSTVKAFNAVIHQNADYVEALRNGAPLVYGNENVKQLTDLLVQKMVNELENPQTIQAQRIKQLLKEFNPYALSGKATWLVNDVATLQAIYEEMDHGASMMDAIHDVGKHIPNYRIPATVLNSEGLAKAISNPNLTMFGAYHYGALKSYLEMAKDLVNPDKFKEVQPNVFEEQNQSDRNKTRAKQLDKLVMLALIGFVIYPMLDKLAQKLTNNKAAKLRRAGATTFFANSYLLATGQMQWLDYLTSIVTPAVGTKEGLQLALNRDIRTGQPIITSPLKDQPKEALGQLGSNLVKQVAPLDKATQIKSGKLSFKDFGLSLLGISNPANVKSLVPVQNQIYDERPVLEKQIKDLYAKGETEEGSALIREFNNRLLNNLKKASEDAGTPKTDQQIKQQASQYFLSVPTSLMIKKSKKTLDSQSSLDKLFTKPKKPTTRKILY